MNKIVFFILVFLGQGLIYSAAPAGKKNQKLPEWVKSYSRDSMRGVARENVRPYQQYFCNQLGLWIENCIVTPLSTPDHLAKMVSAKKLLLKAMITSIDLALDVLWEKSFKVMLGEDKKGLYYNLAINCLEDYTTQRTIKNPVVYESGNIEIDSEEFSALAGKVAGRAKELVVEYCDQQGVLHKKGKAEAELLLLQAQENARQKEIQQRKKEENDRLVQVRAEGICKVLLRLDACLVDFDEIANAEIEQLNHRIVQAKERSVVTALMSQVLRDGAIAELEARENKKIIEEQERLEAIEAQQRKEQFDKIKIANQACAQLRERVEYRTSQFRIDDLSQRNQVLIERNAALSATIARQNNSAHNLHRQQLQDVAALMDTLFTDFDSRVSTKLGQLHRKVDRASATVAQVVCMQNAAARAISERASTERDTRVREQEEHEQIVRNLSQGNARLLGENNRLRHKCENQQGQLRVANDALAQRSVSGQCPCCLAVLSVERYSDSTGPVVTVRVLHEHSGFNEQNYVTPYDLSGDVAYNGYVVASDGSTSGLERSSVNDSTVRPLVEVTQQRFRHRPYT